MNCNFVLFLAPNAVNNLSDNDLIGNILIRHIPYLMGDKQ